MHNLLILQEFLLECRLHKNRSGNNHVPTSKAIHMELDFGRDRVRIVPISCIPNRLLGRNQPDILNAYFRTRNHGTSLAGAELGFKDERTK